MKQVKQAQAAIIAMLRTADVVRRNLAAVIEPYGITLQQYNVLRILRGAAPEPLPTLEIGDRLIERVPGTTRLLDRLEEKGLVRRERHAGDRRQVLCWITPAGRALLSAMDDEIDRADAAITCGLSRDQVAQLTRLLQLVEQSNN